MELFSELFSTIGFEIKENECIKVPIKMLQIDVEGYEVFIMQSLMDEILDEEILPRVTGPRREKYAGRKVDGTKIETTFNSLSKRMTGKM